MAIALGGVRCPAQDLRTPCHARARPRSGAPTLCWTRPSPDTARRSGSRPITPIGHHGLGNALIRKDKLDEASAAYREAIRLKPDDAEGHYGLGNALKGQGKLDEAIAEYREAIRLKPDHAEAHCNLGSALKGQGKLDEASAEYREAIRLNPDYAEAHSNLGGILKSRGDDAGALAMYRKWREINKYATGLHPSAEIRSQTLDWLKAERDAWSKLMDGGDANARAQPRAEPQAEEGRNQSGRRPRP